MKVLTIHVKHTWPRDEVLELGPDEYEVRSKLTPKRGRANKDALKILARYLKLSESQLMVTSNEGSPIKQVLVLE